MEGLTKRTHTVQGSHVGFWPWSKHLRADWWRANPYSSIPRKLEQNFRSRRSWKTPTR